MLLSKEIAHTDKVRATFEEPRCYLDSSRHNIRIRAETVREFVRGCHHQRILDIGCGDGSISLPLLRSENRLTLVDISAAMLSAAKARIPVDFRRNVDWVNDDFLSAQLVGQYDLILCVGVLAHVGSPESVVAKICSLLEPGGSVIAQNTDCSHPVSRALGAYGKLRDRVRPAPYCTMSISAEELVNMFATHGLKLKDEYRYISPLPGMARVLNDPSLYRLTRWLHGDYPRSRNAALGNEYLCRFVRVNT